jgi:hypothetical protein
MVQEDGKKMILDEKQGSITAAGQGQIDCDIWSQKADCSGLVTHSHSSKIRSSRIMKLSTVLILAIVATIGITMVASAKVRYRNFVLLDVA